MLVQYKNVLSVHGRAQLRLSLTVYFLLDCPFIVERTIRYWAVVLLGSEHTSNGSNVSQIISLSQALPPSGNKVKCTAPLLCSAVKSTKPTRAQLWYIAKLRRVTQAYLEPLR